MIEIKIVGHSVPEVRAHFQEWAWALGFTLAQQRELTEAEKVEILSAGPGPIVPAEESKAKRGRKAAEKEPAPVPEPVAEAPEAEPAIRATPEDRQPVETVEEAVVVGTPSLEDLKAAMAKVQEARGMPWLVANVGELLGAPRASAVAEGDRAAAIARLEEAARG